MAPLSRTESPLSATTCTPATLKVDSDVRYRTAYSPQSSTRLPKSAQLIRHVTSHKLSALLGQRTASHLLGVHISDTDVARRHCCYAVRVYTSGVTMGRLPPPPRRLTPSRLMRRWSRDSVTLLEPVQEPNAAAA